MDITSPIQLDILMILSGVCFATAFFAAVSRSLPSKRRVLLVLMGIASGVLMTAERYSYVYRGVATPSGFVIVRLSNFLVFTITYVVTYLYVCFMHDIMTHEGKLETRPGLLDLIKAICVFAILMVVISQYTGLYYTIDSNNLYHRSALYPLSFIPASLIFPLLFISIIRYGKSLSKGIKTGFYMFLIVPLVATILQPFCYGFSLTSCSLVLPILLVLYIELQEMDRQLTQANKMAIDSLTQKQIADQQLISALSDDYTNIYEINLETNSLKIIKQDSRVGKKLGNSVEKMTFDEALDLFTHEFINEADNGGMLSALEAANLEKNLDGVAYFEKVFINDIGKYTKIKIVKTGPQKRIVGFGEKDEEIRREKAYQLQLEEQHSELVAALDEANAASQAKTIFLTNMSHDIRTPMNAIVGYTDLAMLHKDDQKQTSEYLYKISLASERLMELINDILDMSRIENGKWTIREEVVSISASKDNLESIFASTADRKNIDYSINIDKVNHDLVLSDKRSVNRILMNIVSNSLKFTQDNGKVCVSVEEKDTKNPSLKVFEFVCQDNGVGMTPEFLQKIFDPFERERYGTESESEGAGLGMAIVSRLVDHLNGTIQIFSEPGEGTRVVVDLPLKISENSTVSVSSPVVETHPTLEGKHILVVDDVEINREIASLILQEQKMIVDFAENGEVAVEKYKHDPNLYDVILMDIQMPVMNGYEATKTIRSLETQTSKTVPIIAMTANAFAQDKARAVEAGMNDHVAKPIDTKVLYKTIENFFDNQN